MAASTKPLSTNTWSGNALVRPRHVEDRNVLEREERRSLDETSLSDERMQQREWPMFSSKQEEWEECPSICLVSEMLDKLNNAVHQAEGINEQFVKRKLAVEICQ